MLSTYLIKHDAGDRIRLAAGVRARRRSAENRVQSADFTLQDHRGKSKRVEALPDCFPAIRRYLNFIVIDGSQWKASL